MRVGYTYMYTMLGRSIYLHNYVQYKPLSRLSIYSAASSNAAMLIFVVYFVIFVIGFDPFSLCFFFNYYIFLSICLFINNHFRYVLYTFFSTDT